MDETSGPLGCLYDQYVLTRALAELALVSKDAARLYTLRARVAARAGKAQDIGQLAVSDAENGTVRRAKIHVCRDCRRCDVAGPEHVCFDATFQSPVIGGAQVQQPRR